MGGRNLQGMLDIGMKMVLGIVLFSVKCMDYLFDIDQKCKNLYKTCVINFFVEFAAEFLSS